MAAAEQLYREFLNINRQNPGNEENSRTMLTGLAEVMLAQERGADAEPLALEALRLSEKTHASVWAAQVLLGSALVERAAFLEAEPLLLTSYKTISDDLTISAKSKQKVLQRVIGLYEAWEKASPNRGKAAEAARWRALLHPAP